MRAAFPIVTEIGWLDLVSAIQYTTRGVEWSPDEFTLEHAEMLEKLARRIRALHKDTSIQDFRDQSQLFRQLVGRAGHAARHAGRSSIAGIPTQLLEIRDAISRYEGHLYPPCVYFLCRDGIVVYVGRTTNIAHRIGAHIRQGEKKFDEVFTLPIKPERLGIVERHYINLFKPEYNQAGYSKESKPLEYPVA